MKTGRTECFSGIYIVKTNPLTLQTEVRIPHETQTSFYEFHFFCIRQRQTVFDLGRIPKTAQPSISAAPTKTAQPSISDAPYEGQTTSISDAPYDGQTEFRISTHAAALQANQLPNPTTVFFWLLLWNNIDPLRSTHFIFFDRPTIKDRIFFWVHSVQLSIRGVPVSYTHLTLPTILLV